MLIQSPAKSSQMDATRFIFYKAAYVGIGFLYCLVYTWIYYHISQHWSYMGARFAPDSAIVLAIVFIATSMLPLLTPNPSHRFSSTIISILYFTIFVPSILTPYLQAFLEIGYLIRSQIVLSLAFFILGALSVPGGRPFSIRVRYSSRFYLSIVAIVWMAVNLYIYYTFRGNLGLAGLYEVYDRRFSSDYIVGGGLVVYAIANLAGAFNPFLMAVGLAKRYPLLVIASIASNVFLYSTIALRAHIVQIVFCLLIFLLFSLKVNDWKRILYIFLAPLSVCILFLPIISAYNPLGGAGDQLISILMFRTLEMPGILYGCYLDFFSLFPHTFYSHIRPIALLIPYPYGTLQIGQVVAYYIAPEAGLETLNVNASFIATDGIAALGLSGVLVISAFAGLVLRVIAKLIATIDLRIAIVTLLPGIVNLSNSSLFTSALTGGGIVAVLLLTLWSGSDQAAPQDRNESESSRTST